MTKMKKKKVEGDKSKEQKAPARKLTVASLFNRVHQKNKRSRESDFDFVKKNQILTHIWGVCCANDDCSTINVNKTLSLYTCILCMYLQSVDNVEGNPQFYIFSYFFLLSTLTSACLIDTKNWENLLIFALGQIDLLPRRQPFIHSFFSFSFFSHN